MNRTKDVDTHETRTVSLVSIFESHSFRENEMKVAESDGFVVGLRTFYNLLFVIYFTALSVAQFILRRGVTLLANNYLEIM
jgi:hypothetical protein